MGERLPVIDAPTPFAELCQRGPRWVPIMVVHEKKRHVERKPWMLLRRRTAALSLPRDASDVCKIRDRESRIFQRCDPPPVETFLILIHSHRPISSLVSRYGSLRSDETATLVGSRRNFGTNSFASIRAIVDPKRPPFKAEFQAVSLYCSSTSNYKGN